MYFSSFVVLLLDFHGSFFVHFQAYMVLGKFLMLKKDTQMFTEWLKDTTGANSAHARSCAQCLTEWCDAFL